MRVPLDPEDSMKPERIAGIAVVFVLTGFAQEKAQITGVGGAAGGAWVAIGGLGTIYGTNLSSASVSATTSTPWPTKLGDTEVWICGSPTVFIDRCIPAGLTYAGPTQINFYAPE